MWNEGRLPEDWTVEKLLSKHSSRPYNPDIAYAFFRSGYVEAWGRGIEKMTELCSGAGLPAPQIIYEGSDFWITFPKDIYSEVYLKKLGLHERQIKAVLFVKENGKITNSEYQLLNAVSRRTATRDLNELVNMFNIFTNNGMAGYGSAYGLIAPIAP
jgi:ATP-dependent DNA helicase RecG